MKILAWEASTGEKWKLLSLGSPNWKHCGKKHIFSPLKKIFTNPAVMYINSPVLLCSSYSTPPLAPLTDRNKPAVWAATPREAGWIYIIYILYIQDADDKLPKLQRSRKSKTQKLKMNTWKIKGKVFEEKWLKLSQYAGTTRHHPVPPQECCRQWWCC